MEYYVVGQIVRLAHAVVDDAGAPTNVSTITLIVTLPDHSTFTTSSATNTAVGAYRYDFVSTQAGRHVYRWNTTGPVAPDDGSFDVYGPSLALINLQDAKAQLNKISPIDDEELRRLVESATSAVERHLDKAVVRRTVVEKRDLGNAAGRAAPGILQSFTLSTKPVLSLTSVVSAVVGLSWNPANMQVTEAGVVRVLAGAIVWGPVVFTYEAGMTVIPAEYAEAAGIIVQHIWQNTQRGQKGGTRAGLETAGAFGYSIPYAALDLLGPSISGIA